MLARSLARWLVRLLVTGGAAHSFASLLLKNAVPVAGVVGGRWLMRRRAATRAQAAAVAQTPPVADSIALPKGLLMSIVGLVCAVLVHAVVRAVVAKRNREEEHKAASKRVAAVSETPAEGRTLMIVKKTPTARMVIEHPSPAAPEPAQTVPAVNAQVAAFNGASRHVKPTLEPALPVVSAGFDAPSIPAAAELSPPVAPTGNSPSIARRLQFEWIEAQLANSADLDDEDADDDMPLDHGLSPLQGRSPSHTEKADSATSTGWKPAVRLKSPPGLFGLLRRTSKAMCALAARQSDNPSAPPEPTEHVTVSLVRLSLGVLLGCCVRWPAHQRFPLIVRIEEGGVLHQV